MEKPLDYGISDLMVSGFPSPHKQPKDEKSENDLDH
jgi:hypothetical protein